jgi:predicted RNA-binding Zn ribbon-like protein
MDFGSYMNSSVALMVELANSYDPRLDPPEQLSGVAATEAFLRQHRMLGPNRVAEADVTGLRDLRDRIRAVFEADDEDTALRRLNEILAAAGVVPNVQRHGNGRRELFFATAGAALPSRVACDAGIGLAMMMVEHAERLKVCAGSPCRRVFVDESRNRSRRYCSNPCASRSTVAAYRSRQRAAGNARG